MIDRKFKTDTVFSYLAQGGVILCGFIFLSLITHYAGLAIYGVIVILVALSSMLSNLIGFRTNEAAIAFYRQGAVWGDPARKIFALYAGMVLDIVMGAIFVGALYLNAEIIANNLIKDPSVVDEVRLYAVVQFFLFLRATPVAYLQATERFVAVNLLSLGEQLCKVALVFGNAVIFGALSLRMIVFAILLSAAITSSIAYIGLLVDLVRKFRNVKWSVTGQVFRSYMSFSLNTFLSSSLKAGSQSIDTLILGYITNTHTAGIYGLLRQFQAPITFLSTPFATLAYPRFVTAVAEGNKIAMIDVITNIEKKIFNVYFGLFLLTSLALLSYVKWFHIQLNRADIAAFIIMSCTAMLGGVLWWARPFSNSVDTRLSLNANLFAALFSIVAFYPMTLMMGIAGTALGGCVLMIILFGYWRRRLHCYGIAIE